MQSSTLMKASDYSDYKFDLGFSNSKKTTVVEEIVTDNTIPYIPTINQEIADDEENLLRRFHLGDPNIADEAITENYVPALLHAYRDASKIRYDYPLFLYPAEDTEIKANQLAKSAAPELWNIVESFAPGSESARVLKDNLPRLERYLRETLPEGPVPAIPMLSQAGQVLQQELGLDAENNDRFVADFNKLLNAIQPEVQFLGYGRFVAIHLLNHAICNRLILRQADFKSKVERYIDNLKKLLEVEWGKSDESIEPRMMRDSVGSAGERFDPMALSEVMTHSKGSVVMSSERHVRISNILQILEAFLQENEQILVRIIHLGSMKGDWLDNNITIETSIETEPTKKARAVFEQQAKKLAKVFKAVRIAQLELDNVYDSVLHDPWFANFTWEAFSKEELLVLPVVIALESADRMASEGMHSLSRLLSSGQPIHVLIGVRAHDNPHSTNNDENFLNYRFELGYFGISHRQAAVSQSSSARHGHLLKQFLSALDATRTSLHIINTGMQRSVIYGINAWLVAGAALESRAHPFFHVNPESGDAAADRVNFAGNPQPELDWAKHNFQYKDVNDEIINTELAFTFADYTLLVPHLNRYFRVVPAGYENEALIPIETYLSTSGWKDYKQLPFIWAVNDQGELHKLVVSRPLIVACRDRLNYWHTLQELAGINNKYVDLAVQTTKEDDQASAKAELESLQVTQAEQLEQARRETAGDTMQKLSEMLLGMDLTAASPIKSSVIPDLTQEVVEELVIEKTVPVIEEIIFDDPWIDSDLCTSCNDCLNINGMMFEYNDSKQAVLGNLGSGTYTQLVEAAEICPAVCIHPGKPNDPNEAGMEELIKRAEPFNKLVE